SMNLRTYSRSSVRFARNDLTTTSRSTPSPPAVRFARHTSPIPPRASRRSKTYEPNHEGNADPLGPLTSANAAAASASASPLSLSGVDESGLAGVVIASPAMIADRVVAQAQPPPR